jgi:hypothetical protein
MKNSPVSAVAQPSEIGVVPLESPPRPTLRVVPWDDPIEDTVGVHPRSLYVELFWLPVAGPAATWLFRHLVDELEQAPDGLDLDLDQTARSLGLGGTGSRRDSLGRAVARCTHYGLSRRIGADGLAVRRVIGRVPRRQLIRLPANLQERHRAWESDRAGDGANAVLVRRTRLVALDLRLLGVDAPGIERHLQRRGTHPSLAYESAQWAWNRAEDETTRSAAQSVP